MAKSKSIYVCGECGHESIGWLGKCPVCSEWNTFFEQKITEVKSKGRKGIGDAAITGRVKAYKISEARELSEKETKQGSSTRIKSGIGEFDRVLGGGIVRDSLILVGGDPGIGKSTILLQIAGKIKDTASVLYVSGEESVSQISMRAERLSIESEELLLLSETNFEAIEMYIDEVKPEIIVIDSIQTVFMQSVDAIPGSVSQVRSITAALMRIAKNNKIAIFIVGHVTKDGNIAGPKVLEHMVDTVLYFEGDNHMNYRILRGVKNRFGSTNEIGIFEMREEGLQEVPSPSESMLSGRPVNEPGSVVVSTIEGSRAMLVEVQALVSATAFGNPRRMATGFDYNRMSLLLAVLEKKIGIMVGDKDAYINVIGGLKLTEPACDLGVAAALISSIKEISCDPHTVYIGEVGLAGELRSVSQIEKRIGEAARMGFKTIFIPNSNYEALEKMKTNALKNVKLVPVKNISEVVKFFSAKY